MDDIRIYNRVLSPSEIKTLYEYESSINHGICRGVELSDDSPVEMPFPQQGGAESGALLANDERLRVLLEAWAELPESVKTAVLEA